MSARFDQIIQYYVSNHQFMGSVLVAKGDQTLLDRGYGSANLEWNVPNSPAGKFRLGSITKQFTSTCILLLEQRGKLNVQDPVKKYVPDAPAAWDKITIYAPSIMWTEINYAPVEPVSACASWTTS